MANPPLSVIWHEEDESPVPPAGLCPKWGSLGHNWVVIKGWLPWRRYRVCCACGHEERIR